MTRTFLDVNGDVIADEIEGVDTTYETEGVVTVRYTVEVTVAIAAPSVQQIIPKKLTSTASISFVYPEDLQLSSPPISGSYNIACYHPDEVTFPNPFYTRNIGFDKRYNNVRDIL